MSMEKDITLYYLISLIPGITEMKYGVWSMKYEV